MFLNWPCYTMQFFQQLVSQCRCETSCWRNARCTMHGLSRNIFVARSVARSRTQLYFSQRIAATGNTIAQCITPPATCLAEFYGSFNKGICAHFFFFVPKSIARQFAEKIAQCNRASTPNLGNLQRYIFNHCKTNC